MQPSPIHGQGLFAVGRVRRGTELRYIGVTFPSLSTIRKYYEERNPPPYVMATGTPADYYIDAGDVPCLARYANHAATDSAERNAEFVVTEGAILLVLTDDLDPGTEVRVDYGDLCVTIGGSVLVRTAAPAGC